VGVAVPGLKLKKTFSTPDGGLRWLLVVRRMGRAIRVILAVFMAARSVTRCERTRGIRLRQLSGQGIERLVPGFQPVVHEGR
jgi:hypothetical protein